MCLLLAFSLGCASIHGCRRAAEAPLAGKPSPEQPLPDFGVAQTFYNRLIQFDDQIARQEKELTALRAATD